MLKKSTKEHTRSGLNFEQIPLVPLTLFSFKGCYLPSPVREASALDCASCFAGALYHINNRNNMLTLFQSHEFLWHCKTVLLQLLCKGEKKHYKQKIHSRAQCFTYRKFVYSFISPRTKSVSIYEHEM